MELAKLTTPGKKYTVAVMLYFARSLSQLIEIESLTILIEFGGWNAMYRVTRNVAARLMVVL
jgi:hypothetical protein